MSAKASLYYTNKWRQGEYATSHPNADELIRLAAIKQALAKYAVSDTGGTGVTRRPLAVDVGCGRGWLASALSDNYVVTGIDPVPDAISVARQLFGECRFCAADPVEYAAARPAAFDLLVSSEVIEHVGYPQQEAFLRGCYELVTRDGLAIFTTPRKHYLSYCRRTQRASQPVEDWLSDIEFVTLLRRVGFSILHHGRIWKRGYANSHYTRLLESTFFDDMSPSWAAELIHALRNRVGIYQIAVCRKPRT